MKGYVSKAIGDESVHMCNTSAITPSPSSPVTPTSFIDVVVVRQNEEEESFKKQHLNSMALG